MKVRQQFGQTLHGPDVSLVAEASEHRFPERLFPTGLTGPGLNPVRLPAKPLKRDAMEEGLQACGGHVFQRSRALPPQVLGQERARFRSRPTFELVQGTVEMGLQSQGRAGRLGGGFRRPKHMQYHVAVGGVSLVVVLVPTRRFPVHLDVARARFLVSELEERLLEIGSGFAVEKPGVQHDQAPAIRGPEMVASESLVLPETLKNRLHGGVGTRPGRGVEMNIGLNHPFLCFFKNVGQCQASAPQSPARPMNRNVMMRTQWIWMWRVTFLGVACLAVSAWADDKVGEVRRDAVVRAVERAMPAVVNIATEEVVPVRDPIESLFREFFDPYHRRRVPNTQYSLGSGVLVDEEGYIITNHHVVSRARRIWVRLHDGREMEAERLAWSPGQDIAVLRLKGAGEERFSAIRFARNEDLLLGETVIALGNPFGLGGSVSRGILSSKSRRPPQEGLAMDVYDWLQTDAAINPGNSGGALINLDGDLIGINVAVFREGQGIGFALPIRQVVEALNDLFSPEEMGQVWFGARLRPGRDTVEVMEVIQGSPAEAAGLEPGDGILEMEGEPVAGYFNFCLKLAEKGEGGKVPLVVDREGRRRKVEVELVAESSFFNEDLILKRTGMSLQTLTPALARAMGLGRVRGMLIGDVKPETPAAKVGLERGMVITGMDGERVGDLVAVARTIHGKAPGATVRLDLVVSRQRGRLLLIEEAVATLELP